LQTAHVLENLPERVVVTWPHHALYGTDLAVHGWQHLYGEIHLLVTMLDGSKGCLPVAWTDLLPRSAGREEGQTFSVSGVRALRLQLDALRGHVRPSPEQMQAMP